MALIKCPECGNEVSEKASLCPRCGYPLKEEGTPKAAVDYPKPIDNGWINKWKKKAKEVKIVCTVFFLACLIGLIVSIAFLTKNPANTVYITFTSVFAALTAFSFLCFLGMLSAVQVRAKQFDGYTVLVYSGLKKLLIVEDVIQDRETVSRYLSGRLPNEKEVWAAISMWDGSIRIGLGSEDKGESLI